MSRSAAERTILCCSHGYRFGGCLRRSSGWGFGYWLLGYWKTFIFKWRCHTSVRADLVRPEGHVTYDTGTDKEVCRKARHGIWGVVRGLFAKMDPVKNNGEIRFRGGCSGQNIVKNIALLVVGGSIRGSLSKPNLVGCDWSRPRGSQYASPDANERGAIPQLETRHSARAMPPQRHRTSSILKLVI